MKAIVFALIGIGVGMSRDEIKSWGETVNCVGGGCDMIKCQSNADCPGGFSCTGELSAPLETLNESLSGLRVGKMSPLGVNRGYAQDVANGVIDGVWSGIAPRLARPGGITGKYCRATNDVEAERNSLLRAFQNGGSDLGRLAASSVDEMLKPAAGYLNPFKNPQVTPLQVTQPTPRAQVQNERTQLAADGSYIKYEQAQPGRHVVREVANERIKDETQNKALHLTTDNAEKVSSDVKSSEEMYVPFGSIFAVAPFLNFFNLAKTDTQITCLNPIGEGVTPDGIVSFSFVDERPNNDDRVLTEVFDALRGVKQDMKSSESVGNVSSELMAQNDTSAALRGAFEANTSPPMVYIKELSTGQNVADEFAVTCLEEGRFQFSFLIEVSYGTTSLPAKQVCKTQVICAAPPSIAVADIPHPLAGGISFGTATPNSLTNQNALNNQTEPIISPLDLQDLCANNALMADSEGIIRFDLERKGTSNTPAVFDRRNGFSSHEIVGVAELVNDNYQKTYGNIQSFLCGENAQNTERTFIALVRSPNGSLLTQACPVEMVCQA